MVVVKNARQDACGSLWHLLFRDVLLAARFHVLSECAV